MLVLALLYAPCAMPYCDIAIEYERCNPEDCYAAGGRCLPELTKSVPGTASFTRNCRQGVREHESILKFKNWSLWKKTKDACMDCCCKRTDRSALYSIQPQQELEDFVTQTEKQRDIHALTQKIVGDAELCEMGGSSCDVTQCSADGICCLMGSNIRCAPHFIMTGIRTMWIAHGMPASCRGCNCRRIYYQLGGL
jgi:hypothetical protein